MTVHRLYRFCASHRLHVPAFSDEKNAELFGKCNNPFGHGHNYELEVSVRGPVDESTGRTVDRAALDQLVHRVVVERYDHRYLNAELPEFADQVPTTENLGKHIEAVLSENWSATFPGEWPKLQRIRISETERNTFEVAAAG